MGRGGEGWRDGRGGGGVGVPWTAGACLDTSAKRCSGHFPWGSKLCGRIRCNDSSLAAISFTDAWRRTACRKVRIREIGHRSDYSCPLGRWVLKYRPLFFFFFSVENVHFNWIIGFSGTRDVFLSRANSTARCRRCFVAEFFQFYIVFLVVTSFAKTKCYSPSNLLVRSAMCRTSATYQLLTCRKWYVQHSKHSMIILVTKPLSITPVLSLSRKAS